MEVGMNNLFLQIGLGLLIICSTIISQEAKEFTLYLMPVPKKVSVQQGKFRLNNNFALSTNKIAGERFNNYASRFLARLSGRTGLFFSQFYITDTDISDTASMKIQFDREGKLVLKENESYQIIISDNKIILSAVTDIGAMRGLETILQLLSVDDNGYYFPAINIDDAPRFPWRGLHIDVSRHFLPVEVLKRNIDAMTALKMNVFHWDMTNDQGFRIECKTFPKLHELGSDGLYYTQEQVKGIIKYAADRGIRTVLQFDTPAHTTSWFVGYPELASGPGPYTIERGWGIKDPVINPIKEESYEFLDKFFAEMTELIPDEYLHIGGDENNGKQWSVNPDIQAYMKEKNIADTHTLQVYYTQRVYEIVSKYGKKIIGWDEVFDADLPKDVLVHSWRGIERLNDAVQKGYNAILSRGYYVDLMHSTESHYLVDPIPEDSPLNATERTRVLGGESCSWGELISYETIDKVIWPRTAAIAERLWSPASVKNVDDMYRRIEIISYQLEELGLLHIKNYEMMLRRLTNNKEIKYLSTLLDLIEPVKNYSRHHQGVKYSQSTPLTRVVDAANPESIEARKFSKLIDSFCESPNEKLKQKIVDKLNVWKNNHEYLLVNIKLSPILREIESMSKDLAIISEIGIQALTDYEGERKRDEKWLNDISVKFEAAKSPRGQTKLKVVEAIEKLVNFIYRNQ
jgi:hexosaminidase